jgi:hypothetical protein
MRLDRPIPEGRGHDHAGSPPLGRRRPAPREQWADLGSVLAARTGAGLSPLRRCEVRRPAGRARKESFRSARFAGRRSVGLQREGVIYLPAEARFERLLHFPEGGLRGQGLGKAVDEAIRAIEKAIRSSPVSCRGHTRASTPACSRSCSRRSPRFRWISKVTPSGRSTSTSFRSSRPPKARWVASSTPRPASCGCWSRCSSRSAAASSTPPVARAAARMVASTTSREAD